MLALVSLARHDNHTHCKVLSHSQNLSVVFVFFSSLLRLHRRVFIHSILVGYYFAFSAILLNELCYLEPRARVSVLLGVKPFPLPRYIQRAIIHGVSHSSTSFRVVSKPSNVSTAVSYIACARSNPSHGV